MKTLKFFEKSIEIEILLIFIISISFIWLREQDRIDTKHGQSVGFQTNLNQNIEIVEITHKHVFKI